MYVSWLVGSSYGWLAGWVCGGSCISGLVGWLFGRLVGWLVLCCRWYSSDAGGDVRRVGWLVGLTLFPFEV